MLSRNRVAIAFVGITFDLLACNGLATDNASYACETHPPPHTVTVYIDQVAAMGTANISGDCTNLECSVEDDGGCDEWQGQMTRLTADASCIVTFEYVDGGTTGAVLFTEPSCNTYVSETAVVHDSYIATN